MIESFKKVSVTSRLVYDKIGVIMLLERSTNLHQLHSLQQWN